MVAISNATIRANVFETIYDAVGGATYTGASSTPTVTAAYISGSDASFPQIVVSPVEVDKDAGVFAAASNVSPKMLRVVVTVYTSGASSNKDRDIIGDKIESVLSTTKYAGITLIGFSESVADTTIGGNKIRSRVMSFTYRRL